MNTKKQKNDNVVRNLIKAAEQLLINAIDTGSCCDEENGGMLDDWKALDIAIDKIKKHSSYF